MVYSNRFVMCVLVNGTPLKELHDGSVLIPYGTEYSLRFRNKNDRRAVVKFSIDGEDVSGPGFVVPANGFVDIHRYADKDQQFKAVFQESADAVDYGKNGPDPDNQMGVIVADFYFEKKALPVKEVHHHHHYPQPSQPYPVWPTRPNYPYPRKPDYPYPPHWGGSVSLGGSGASSAGGGFVGGFSTTAGTKGTLHADMSASVSSTASNDPPVIESAQAHVAQVEELPEQGKICTVPGSASGQKFQSTYIDTETESTRLKLVLRGTKKEIQVAPVSQEASYCVNCGSKKSRKSDKFCGQCGHRFMC